MRFQSQIAYSVLFAFPLEISLRNFFFPSGTSLCPMREKVNSKIREMEMEMELELGECQVASCKYQGWGIISGTRSCS
jgi:hypothetical protein